MMSRLVALLTLVAASAPLAATPLSFEDGQLPAGFATDATTGWYVDDGDALDGTRSLRSGIIDDSAESTVEWTVDIEVASTLSFGYRVAAESCCDYLELRIDGVGTETYSSNREWSVWTVTLPAGRHVISWIYRKDGSVAVVPDSARIDNVQLTPLVDLLTRARLGDLASAVNHLSFNGGRDARLLDIDADGADELLLAHRSYRHGHVVSFWTLSKWNGSGWMVDRVGPIGAFAIGAMDAVADGQGGIIVAVSRGDVSYGGNWLEVYHNAETIWTREGPHNPRLALADIDADGTIELIVSGGIWPGPDYCPCSVSAYSLDQLSPLWELALDDSAEGIAIADLLDNEGLELVLAGTPGLIADAADGSVLWNYPTGFGPHVEIGNFDPRAGLEFIAGGHSSRDTTIFDAAAQSPLLSLPAEIDGSAYRSIDVDGDGLREIIVAASSIFAPATLQRRDLPGSFSSGESHPFEVGSLAGDGGPQLIFKQWHTLQTIDLDDGAVTSTQPLAEAPAPVVRMANVSGDDRLELVSLVARHSSEDSGWIEIRDAQSLALVSRFEVSSLMSVPGFELGQRSGDDHAEIMLARTTGSGPQFVTYGADGTLMSTQLFANGDASAPTAMKFIDPSTMLIAQNRRLRLLDLAATTSIWESASLDSDVLAIEVADIDADGNREAIVLLHAGVIASIDLQTRLLDWSIQASGATSLAVSEALGEVYATVTDDRGSLVDAYDGASGARARSFPTLVEPWAVSFADTGARSLLLTIMGNGTMEVFDALRESRLGTFALPEYGLVPASAIAPLACASSSSTVDLWAASSVGVHRFSVVIEPRGTRVFADGFEPSGMAAPGQ